MKIKTATVIENPTDEQMIVALRAEFGAPADYPKRGDIVRIGMGAPAFAAMRLGIVIGDIDSDGDIEVGSFDNDGDRDTNYINARHLSIVIRA